MSDSLRSRVQPPVSPEASSSRRQFLGRVLALGAAGLGGSTILAACGGSDDPAAGGSDATRVVDASTCEGYAALDQPALQTRTALNYVDESAKEGQYCTNCRFLKALPEASPCEGCQLFAGPVSPGGWCQSWTVQAT